jgi:hypothetical protein
MATNATFHTPYSVNRSHPAHTWIGSRSWDWRFLFASCLLVFLTYGLYRLGIERLVVNMLVTLFIGGPHMFSTYTQTLMDRQFVRRFPYLIALAALIPIFVFGVGLAWFALLLTVFFTLASGHVAQQFSYIAALYRRRAGLEPSLLVQVMDAGLVLSSLYLPAMYLLVNGDFRIGEKDLLFPAFLQSEALWYLAAFVWAGFLSVFLFGLLRDVAARTVVWPRVLLLSLTVPIALYVPTLENLDVAFQGMNAWHSFQYLALIWIVSVARQNADAISPGLVSTVTRRGFPAFYGLCFGLTVAVAAAIMLVSGLVGLPYEQSYYLVVLSFLLIHYAFDHILFLSPSSKDPAFPV